MRTPTIVSSALTLLVATGAAVGLAALNPAQEPAPSGTPAPKPATQPETPDLRKPIDDAKKQIEDAKRGITDAIKKPGEATQPAKGEHPALDHLQKLAAPGAEHDLLRAFVGTFRAEVRTSFAGDSTATTVNTMIFGDRFLKLEFTGSVGETPITSLAYWGYDRARRKYTSVWMDSLSTGTVFAEGDYDSATRSITTIGELFDPAQNKLVKVRQVAKRLSDDEYTVEVFTPGKDGKESVTYRAAYTRERR